MTYDEFEKEYSKLFKLMMNYSPNEVGSAIYAEKMAELADEYPEFAELTEED